jgi:DNA helicase-2/ATP-dependent DNA helicase PcrA
VPKDARTEWDSFAASLDEIAEAKATGSPDHLVELAMNGWYGDHIRGAYTNYANRLDDLTSLVGFAGRYEDIGDMLAHVTLLASESGDRGAEKVENSVRLTTVHQSKGLEFDVVFVIGLAEGQFPLKRAIEAGDVEEERRLFYVAVTRAREELYLSAPKMTDRPPSMLQPSRFVQEIDPSLYDVLRLPKRSW